MSKSKPDESEVTVAPEASPAPAETPQATASGVPDASSEEAAPAAVLAELEAKIASGEDRYLRLAADFDNYRKRMGRELQEARTAARLDALLPVLTVFDHFRLAMAAAAEDHDPQVLRQGMEMIEAEFGKALSDIGISVIDAVGQPFNPQFHEATAREPSATVPEGRVVSQWRCGYRLGDRVIRPAAVVISSGPPPAPPADQSEGQA